MSEPIHPPTPDVPPSSGYSTPPPPPPGGYGAPQQPAYGGAPVGAPVSDADERLWGMLAHLGGILIGFISGLIVYLIYKDRSQYLKQQGAEALNFQLTILIGLVVSGILTVIVIGFVTYVAIAIVAVVFGILAGLAANKHENYRYPFAIRFVK